ncbi:hypothetical protein MRX96_049885 [Rhipicephalus microplus]
MVLLDAAHTQEEFTVTYFFDTRSKVTNYAAQFVGAKAAVVVDYGGPSVIVAVFRLFERTGGPTSKKTSVRRRPADTRTWGFRFLCVSIFVCGKRLPSNERSEEKCCRRRRPHFLWNQSLYRRPVT